MPKLPTGFRWLVLVAVVVAGALGFFTTERSGKLETGATARSGRSAAAVFPPVRDESLGLGAPAAATTDAALFTFVRPANATALDAALPAPTRAIHYVRVNAELASGKGSPFWQKPGAGRIEIPLPEGGMLVVAIDGSEMLGADRFTSSGKIEGRPHSRALFAWHAGFLHASIEDPVLG